MGRAGRSLRLLALLLSFLLLLGCGRGGKRPAPSAEPDRAEPAEETPERSATPGQEGALDALAAYAAARRDLDLDRAYSLLTPGAKQLFTREEFIRTYGEQSGYQYTGVEVDVPQGTEARGYVLQLAVTAGKPFKYERFPYTLRYEEGRWGVAQGTPLGLRALRAFDSGRWDEALRIAGEWMELDPYAWEAYLERYYVFKDTGRPEEALASWQKALDLAPPEEHPHLYDVLAMLYARLQEPEPLSRAARKALALADGLGPEQAKRYDDEWRAGVLIDLAFASRYAGDEETAFRHLQEARSLDPQNIDLQRFLRSMPAR